MRQTALSLRKAAIVLVAVYSVLCGVFLVWQLVTRDQVVALSNVQLMGMLALFLLPVATAAAWELDRRTERRRAAAAPSTSTPATVTPQQTVFAHEAGEERSPRHRRRVVGEAVEARR